VTELLTCSKMWCEFGEKDWRVRYRNDGGMMTEQLEQEKSTFNILPMKFP